MNIQALIEALSSPEAFPEGVSEVEVCQTHISVVFLTERWAYKIKKPVELEFVDYSTLEKRRHYCDREVNLNRRLAPEVYRGVVPVVETESGLEVEPGDEDAGEIVEWAVKMVRLPEDGTLQSQLRDGRVEAADFEDLARRLAGFYADAKRGDKISEHARFEAVAGNVRDNLRAAEQQRGELLHPELYERLTQSVERSLESLEAVIESRADADVARDTHGDLRLEHVYLRPDRDGAPFVVVDCIEFNDAFRFADPLSDVAFMAMDLEHEGEWRLARQFAESYLAECRALGGQAAEIAELPSEDEVEALLELYVSYRAAVRAKVKGMKATEDEVTGSEREEAAREAISYWLHALGAVQPASKRPALVLVAGLPGTGKSTVVRALADHSGCEWLDSDVVRKQAAGLDPEQEAPTEPNGGVYADCWSEETYRQLRDRARSALVRGERVVVEATFRTEERRRPLLEMADELAVPAVVMVCEADSEEVEQRLRERDGGPSDAGVEVYRKLREEWEPVSEACDVVRIDTGGEPEAARRQVEAALRERALWGEGRGA